MPRRAVATARSCEIEVPIEVLIEVLEVVVLVLEDSFFFGARVREVSVAAKAQWASSNAEYRYPAVAFAAGFVGLSARCA